MHVAMGRMASKIDSSGGDSRAVIWVGLHSYILYTQFVQNPHTRSKYIHPPPSPLTPNSHPNPTPLPTSLSPPPLRNPNHKTLLPHKPIITKRPPPIPPPFPLKYLPLPPHHQRRDHLPHLHQTHTLPNTRPRPPSKSEEIALHSCHLPLILQPPLRPKSISVFTKDLGVGVSGPWVDADAGAGKEVVSAEGKAAGGDDAGEGEAGGGVEAQGLFDDGLGVGEVLGLYD